MKAGRELDALIAEKVMGLNVQQTTIGDAVCSRVLTYGGWAVLREYSGSLDEAWQVVEKMPYPMTIHRYPDGVYEVTIMMSEFHVIEYAATAPLAICLAALNAMEHPS